MLYKSHRNLYWFIAFLLCPSLSFPKMDKKPCNSQDAEVRKGPWTLEEDLILINYIANHGEGVWNSLAKSAGTSFINKILVFFFLFSFYTDPMNKLSYANNFDRTETYWKKLPPPMAELPEA